MSQRPTYVEMGPLMTTKFEEVRWSTAVRHTRMAARQLARPATQTHTLVHTRSRPYIPSDSHSDSQSDNFVDDYWVTIIHPLSLVSSILVTLGLGYTITVSQFINSRNVSKPLSHDLYTAWLSQSPLCSIWFNSSRHAHARSHEFFAPAAPLCRGTRPRRQKTQTVNRQWSSRKTTDRSIDAWSKLNCYTRKRSTERTSGTDCYKTVVNFRSSFRVRNMKRQSIRSYRMSRIVWHSLL